MSNFEIFVGIFGGLGLFLYGMKLMSDGLENIAGEKLKGILEKITGNKFMGIIVGAIVTAVIQSSSATTVMVVSFVNAQLMTLAQATGVILGADIGTTITAQMVSLDLEAIAPIFIGVGAIVAMAAKKKKTKDVAFISVGFGILFLGMNMMSSSMAPVSEWNVFKNFIVVVGNNPILGVLVGLLMTAILQSSSATTGILVGLASVGTIDLHIAFPMILGCNVGTCVTALIAGLTANRNAKRAALLHLSFKLFGTILFLPFTGLVVNFVSSMSPDNVARQVANAHTLFNVGITIIMLPLSGYIVKLIYKILPDKGEDKPLNTMYLDKKLLETPIVASTQVVKETIRMAYIARDNFELAMRVFLSMDEKQLEKVYENEGQINIIDKEITEYLVGISQHNMPEENSMLLKEAYHTINDIERIGDHAENIADLTRLRIKNNVNFSEEAVNEIKEIFETTLKALNLAIKSYEANEVYDESNKLEIEIDTLEKHFRKSNLKRLSEKVCEIDAGIMLTDILSNLERIGDHANNIATAKVISDKTDSFAVENQ